MAQSGRATRPIYGLVAAGACWLALAVIQMGGGFRLFDLKLSDWRFHVRGQRPASDRIALVEVDDATVRAYGRWPLPRGDSYAVLISMMEGAGARCVGVDIQFLAPDPYDPQGDALLVGATATSPTVVHAYTFFSDASSESPSRGETDSLLERHGFPARDLIVQEVGSVSVPFPSLLLASRSIGHVSLQVDQDGVVRRVPQLLKYRERVYGSMALRLVGFAEGDTGFPALRPAPGGIEARFGGGRRLRLPIDHEGSTTVDFAGNRQVFRHRYSALQLLSWFRDGELDSIRNAVEGRIVLIGSTAEGEVATDIGSTPFSPATPLLYVHANAIDAALRGRFPRPLPDGVYLAVLAVIAGMFGFLFTRLSLPLAAATMAAGAALLAVVNYGLFVTAGWLVPSTLGLVLLPAIYSVAGSYRYVFLERAERERDRELQLARKIQQGLLPVKAPSVPGLDIHGFNLPALEVGGDYFDWIELEDGSLNVALGDVTGHGMGAALLMMLLRASLHAESRAGRPPNEVAQAMNVSLARSFEPGKFATFFLGTFRPQGGVFHYCSAGHDPAFLRKGDRVERLGALLGIRDAAGSHPPLALAAMDDSEYGAGEIPFEPGDVLVIYSDGVPDYPRGKDHYSHERLERFVLGITSGMSARSIADAILADARRFAHGGPPDDDITIVVVRRV